MTGNKILLDTNIISALLKGDDKIADLIDSFEEVFIPVTVIGELYYGAQYSSQISKNISNIERLSATYSVLHTDSETASIYGELKANLRRKGTPIPENDIWIAACAVRHNLKLSTRDKHFKEVKGLKIVSW